MEKVNFEEDRYCPVFKRVIDCEWCYESLMGICGMIKKESIRELDEIPDSEMKEAYQLCKKCKYSEL